MNGAVHAVAVQADGKILVGGRLNPYSGFRQRGIARLNANGTADSSFNPGATFSGFVYSVALQADGRILIGGYFGFDGSYDKSIARLNSDGSRDTNFALATLETADFSLAIVYSVAVQSDGKILIGGDFAHVDGTDRNGFARLNLNGTLNGSFVPELPLSGTVRTIVPLADGKTLVAGWATATARVNADGTRDMTFNSGTNDLGPADGPVYSMAVQPDGKILLTGDFSAVDGTNRSRIARLHANGTLDVSFNASGEITNLDHDSQMRAVALQADGKVLIGGEFDRVAGTPRMGFARLDTDGAVDTTFEANTGPNTIFKPVEAIAVQPDGKLVIGGAFLTINGATRSRIGRVNSDGTLDTDFDAGSGLDGQVYNIARQGDGKYIIGGQFTTVRGAARPGIARLNADGSNDSAFDPASAICNCSALISSLALQSDGKVLIGGLLFVNRTNGCLVARLNANGTLDTGFQPVTNIPGNVNYVIALALQADGKILIGGQFTMVNGAYRPGIARLNTNGSLDLTFTPVYGPETVTLAILPRPDGKILVGGYNAFSEFGTTWEEYFFARLNLDGSADSEFQSAMGGYGIVNTRVNAIALQPDGKVLIGGQFGETPVKGTNRHGILRLNVNGTLDPDFNAATGTGSFVSSIALQPDGKVLIGGNLSPTGGPADTLIARLTTNGGWDSSFRIETRDDSGSSVNSVLLQPDGDVLIGGEFTTIDGVVRPNIARLLGGSALPYLRIARSNSLVFISWPSPSTGFALQQHANLNTSNWIASSEGISDNGTNKFIVVNPANGNRFYRLFKP